MIKGSCYCGAVTYEIEGKLLGFLNCHCGDCRKFAGSAFSSVLVTESEGFTVASGEESVVPYESSPGTHRCFCQTCGCHLYARIDAAPEIVLVQAGTLDDDPQMQPQEHFWVKAKAPWYEITDSLPQHQGGVPE